MKRLWRALRVREDLSKNGGDQVNIPMVSRLTARGVGTGTLVGNEEKIDNYGQRFASALSRRERASGSCG